MSGVIRSGGSHQEMWLPSCWTTLWAVEKIPYGADVLGCESWTRAVRFGMPACYVDYVDLLNVFVEAPHIGRLSFSAQARKRVEQCQGSEAASVK